LAEENIIVLFEDEAALSTEPLSLTRPVWDLRCGMRTLGETIRSHFRGHQVFHHARTYLLDNYPDISAVTDSQLDDMLWINGSLLPDSGFLAVSELAKGSAWMQGGRVVAFRGTPPDDWQAGTELHLDGFQKVEAPADAGRLMLHLWNLVGAMNAQIETEARNLPYLGEIRGSVHQSATLLRADDIFIAEGGQIQPGVVIDAGSGPVILEENVLVGSNAVIEGPAYLGPGTQIKPLSHVRGSSLGEQCRTGGEVSVSIMQGFTNKQHGGFLGHSYIGSWCNLGSGTETSNLKNNYTPVKVQVGSELVDSGQLFVGLMMGDHSKSAIGSVFNTGTVVGVGSLVFGAGFPPRHVPSFHWGGAEKLTPYPLKPTLDTARDVMSRRGRTLSDGDVEILTWIFNNRTTQ
jgi:UDP-N-acetylglucosamine diphosphorylase/glucosamine-1-phosphate N-acetyltransferase